MEHLEDSIVQKCIFDELLQRCVLHLDAVNCNTQEKAEGLQTSRKQQLRWQFEWESLQTGIASSIE